MRSALRRLLLAIPTLIAISMATFVILELPPGDFLDQKVAELEKTFGDTGSRERAAAMRHRYGLDRPLYVRYGLWVKGIVLHGDFGESFRFERPVTELIGERIGWTLLLSFGSMLFVYLLGVPLGVLAASRPGSFLDRALGLAALFGLSLPGFLIALGLLALAFQQTGIPLHGLFSPGEEAAPWSAAKVADLLQHLVVPVIATGLAGGAGLLRIMRTNTLEVLGEPFVRTARAKGLRERTVLFRHAARLAVNPLVSLAGSSLPDLLSGSTIISIVLGLPTLGPLLLQSLLDKDMYLAGTILLFMAALLVAGNVAADLALAWLDPRTREA